MEKNQNHVEGLIGVRVGQYYYIGRAKGGHKKQLKAFKDGGCVELLQAIEIHVMHVKTDDGKIRTDIHPLPIPPTQGPTNLPVNADTFINLGENARIGELYMQCIEQPPRVARPNRRSPIIMTTAGSPGTGIPIMDPMVGPSWTTNR